MGGEGGFGPLMAGRGYSCSPAPPGIARSRTYGQHQRSNTSPGDGDGEEGSPSGMGGPVGLSLPLDGEEGGEPWGSRGEPGRVEELGRGGH